MVSSPICLESLGSSGETRPYLSVERTLNFPDEIKTLGEEFSRNSLFARKAPLKPLQLPGEVVHDQILDGMLQ